MGTIIWQLNDIWPVASWAMIDYYGRWKAVYYEARHFFAPLLLVNEEASVMTQDENINAEPYEIKNSVKLTLCNESMQDRTLTVRWQIREASGKAVREEEVKDVAVPALSAIHLDEVMIDIDRFSQYVSYQMLDEEGAVVSEGTPCISSRNTSTLRIPRSPWKSWTIRTSASLRRSLPRTSRSWTKPAN